MLKYEYVKMYFGRRYRVPLGKHNHYKHSFVSLSVKLINEWLLDDREVGDTR